MIVDVGQWYTHKRQLQTRADAAALAAGVEYARSWQPCVQSSDATRRQTRRRGIANVGRQYAADPEAADYAARLRRLRSTTSNIATQSKLDVVINSTTYTDDTDWTDGGGSPPPGTPCFIHSGDTISPARRPLGRRAREGERPAVAVRRDRGRRSRGTSRARGSRSARPSAGTSSCRSPSRTTSSTRCRFGTTTNASRPTLAAVATRTSLPLPLLRIRRASPLGAAERCGVCR